MAKHNIVMPQLGESITSGTITKWHKQVGDSVEIDETLFEISTEKVESEIPSIMSGRLTQILFPEGANVDVGKVIAYLDDDLNAPVSAPAVESASSASSEGVMPEVAISTRGEESSSLKGNFTPLVKAMAKKEGISLAQLASLSGTGAGGRVTKEDLMAYLAKKTPSTLSAPSFSVPTPAPEVSVAPVIATTPITPTTPSERVSVIPMDNMRKAIAKNMVLSKQISPHVSSCSEVDLTHLVQFREKFKDEFFKQEGFKLTFTPFIARAIILALKDHPYVNASLENDQIILKKDIHLGLAVAVPQNGLVVPVIKSAENLNMLGLCRAISVLAEKARKKKLSMEDLTGGTFTYTNVGSFGTLWGVPIILQPQVGIYSSGLIQKRVVVTSDDSLAIRSMMYGVHTYDHRLVDGELGGRFVESVHHHLRTMNPSTLF